MIKQTWWKYLRVVDKSSTLAVWWEIAGCRILETLDDGLSPSSANIFLHEQPYSPTVFPDPLYPTINVRGVWNWIVSLRVLSNERTL